MCYGSTYVHEAEGKSGGFERRGIFPGKRFLSVLERTQGLTLPRLFLHLFGVHFCSTVM